MSLAFRPMSGADLDWVSAAEREIYTFPWSRQNFADSLHAGYSSWVTELEGEACGYAVLMLVLDEAHLLNISVLEALRGRGLGSLLLDQLCAVSRQGGATQMFLEVRRSNAAGLRLYEKWGFSEIGVRKGYYPAPQGREDAIVMRRAL